VEKEKKIKRRKKIVREKSERELERMLNVSCSCCPGIDVL
jgi:hypothetical protein